VEAPPDPQLAWQAQRRTEERLVAGVDYFARTAPTRPELSAVAWHAAQAGLLFCERGRPGYHCLDTSVVRFQAVFDEMLAARGAPGPTKVAWTIVAPPRCALVVAALGDIAPPAATLRATLTLDDCEVTLTDTEWRAALCHAPTGVCPDGSSATSPAEGADDPGLHIPRPPPPVSCPCFEAQRGSRFAVRGRWSFAAKTQPFATTREGVRSLVSETRAAPAEATDLPLATLAALNVQGSLTFAALTIEVLAATDLDERAVSCARILATESADTFDARLLEPTRCDGVFERDPAPAVALSPVSPAPPPSIAPDAYPHRLAIIDLPRRAATAADLARLAPGWTFKVNPLGFITEATFAKTGLDAKAMSAALAPLVAVGHRYLGFTAPPNVVPNGEGAAGPQVALVDPARPEAFLQVRNDGRGLVVEGHVWPLTCPALPQSPDALLEPWIGQPMTLDIPGHPCDPGRYHTCESSEPTTERRRATRRDLGITALTVLLPSVRTDEIELYCAYVIQVHGNGRLDRPLSGAIDIVTGAALSGTVTEDNLRP